ncbi:MAG: hypothetical protein ACKVN9_04840 [Methylophilaceae bacterium]
MQRIPPYVMLEMADNATLIRPCIFPQVVISYHYLKQRELESALKA